MVTGFLVPASSIPCKKYTVNQQGTSRERETVEIPTKNTLKFRRGS